MLEAKHEVVDVAHDDHVTARVLTPPCVCPQVEDVVKIDVRKEGADAPSLRRSVLRLRPLPVFQHARFQPLLDVA